jgi:hypothetical protein
MEPQSLTTSSSSHQPASPFRSSHVTLCETRASAFLLSLPSPASPESSLASLAFLQSHRPARQRRYQRSSPLPQLSSSTPTIICDISDPYSNIPFEPNRLLQATVPISLRASSCSSPLQHFCSCTPRPATHGRFSIRSWDFLFRSPNEQGRTG